MKLSLSSILVLIIIVLLVIISMLYNDVSKKEIINNQETNLYSLIPIERVTFNAVGQVTEIGDGIITIKKFGEDLPLSLSEDVRVTIFTLISNESDEFQNEPGSLEDVKVGSNISIFGSQMRDGSLIVENITMQNQ